MKGWGSLPATLAIAAGDIIRTVLEHLPGRRQGTTFLARMTPGQRHPLHVDAEDDGCDFRVHVPLVTNLQAVFIEAGVDHHMPVGWAYMIDPTKEHTAFNGGTSDRIHLMFNAVARPSHVP